MCKICNCITLAVILLLISSPAFSSARNGYYHKNTGADFSFFDGMAVYGTPVIDGKISEGEWPEAFSRCIYKYDRDDNRIQYMFQYDNANLYILVHVDDDKIWDDSAGQLWETNQDDGIEIYIDPDNSRDQFLTSQDRVIAFTVNGNQYRFDRGNNSGSTEYYGEISLIKRAVGINGTVNNNLDIDTGYIVEVGIPWAHLGGIVPTDNLISLNIIVVEDDDGGPLDIVHDATRWDQPFEIDRYFKWFGDGLNGPKNYARIYLVPFNDSVPPSTVSDLSLVYADPFSAVISLTAPGDDGMKGQAVSYHIRYSENQPIGDDSQWNNAAIFKNRFIPAVGGKRQELRITGLSPETTYYLAVRGEDASGNTGALPASSFSFSTPAAPAGYGKGRIYPSPAGRFFIYEDGSSFLPVTAPAGITWMGIRDLYNKPLWDETLEKLVNWHDSSESGEAETYIKMLSEKGINLISIFVEDLAFANGKNPYFPDGVSFLEYPASVAGTGYVQETLDFIDDFMTLCGKHDIYVTITPFDTYFYKEYWNYNPYNVSNGGLISYPDQFVTDPSVISAQKKRFEILNNIVSRHTNFFGWHMINEWDNDTFADRDQGYEEARIQWIKNLLSYLRQLDNKSMVFISSVIWQPQFAMKDFLLLGDYFDFVCVHNYTKAVSDPTAAGDSTPVIRPALDSGRLIRYMTGNTVDSRPVMDMEFGPILLESYNFAYTVENDEQVFHNIIWSEFASGTGGMSLRWPSKVLEYNGPQLTTAMIDDQKNMADYFAKTGVSFKDLNSVPWERHVRLTSGEPVEIFASSNGKTGFVYFLKDARKSSAGVYGATAEIKGLKERGEYIVEFWDTQGSGKILRSETITVNKDSFSVSLPDFQKDCFLSFSFKNSGVASLDVPILLTDVSNSLVNINWSLSSDADGAFLYYLFSTSSEIGSIDMGRQTSLSFEPVSGLDFYIAVMAYTDKGITSDFSNIERITIP